VKTITIDMSFPYIAFIKTYFPNAAIHIDKFHLVQALTRELNRHRVSVMNRYKVHNRPLYNQFKRYWKLFLLSPDKLNAQIYTKMPLFKTLTNTQNIVTYLLSHDEVLKNSYELMHDLLEAIRQGDKLQFDELLLSARNQSIALGLRRQIGTFKRLLPYIHNTFNAPQLSNGSIEGLNNKIKVLKRNAFGYRSFTYFRARILLMIKLFSSYEKTVIHLSA
ncbi:MULTISPECIES: transposase, partial [unclassified Granulicatella]|uniref:transposase n=1 Tax=unclassified Granulicatella TaxID=2630493 RepID=UPI001104149A